MIKTIIILLSLSFCLFSGHAQKTEKKKNSPDERISVKKEFDKDGNLIRFDSLRVYNWSSDSSFRFPMDEGWADFFGKDFFDDHFDKRFFSDSAFSFGFPKDFGSFRFFDDDDFFKGFGFDTDSSLLRNFMFRNDTSFFKGPHSSMMLPPGFFTPDQDGLEELERYFEKNFRSFSPKGFFGFPEENDSTGIFRHPRQKEEWEKMIQRQQKEQEEFMKKWNPQKPGRKLEKM